LTRTLIDERHSNSFSAWKAIGSPQKPTEDQVRMLEQASRLAAATDKSELTAENGSLEVSFDLARQGVTLIELEWP
jgi:xylan 1,4-beta-xylosidase